MRQLLFCLLILLVASSCNQSSSTQEEPTTTESEFPNLAYKWGQISLEGTARDTDRFKPRPMATQILLRWKRW